MNEKKQAQNDRIKAHKIQHSTHIDDDDDDMII